MADAPKLTLAELRGIVTDATELAKGARVFDDGDLANLARHEHKLFADAAGSATYKVQATYDGTAWKGRCSCMAARSRPFCKHAAALLVAWQRNPDAFAVSDAPPAGAAGDAKKKKVKTGKADAAALMARGVEQVATLVRELAVAGAAALAEDRAAQVRALGENLREHRLRRLSAKTIALADLLDSARAGEIDGGGSSRAGSAAAGRRGEIDELGYTELLGDLLLTARKLEKHVAGEVLEDRHVEELIGKTWTKKDRAAAEAMDLVEVAFLQRETPDGFTIRESRFVDAAGGGHYSEKQILPGFLVKRTPPKPSHAGKLLRGAGGGMYPGYAPRRTDLENTGAPERLTSETVARVAATALPNVKDAIAALAEHRKDVFAPDALPVTVACDMLIADRGRLQLVDPGGAAIFLPDDDRAADRLATALAGAQLDAVVGDLAFDGALPTLRPLAILVTRGGQRELRSIAVADFAASGSRKVRAAAASESARRSNWALTARGLGLSTAAIALGEIREEMASLVFAGLTSVTARRVEPMAVRLGELGLAKQAELLRAVAARADASERLDDLIKLHQVLAIALARLAGAAQIDRGELAASPMFASVYVRKDAAVQRPHEIARRLARGEINRFEAGALAARYYETQPPDELVDHPFPTWADGSASPFVALAARARPASAVAVATKLLLGGAPGNAREDQISRLRHVGAPRMAAITALRVAEAIVPAAEPSIAEDARRVILEVAKNHRDFTLRNMARMALGRLAGVVSSDDAKLADLRNGLLNASTREDRARCAERLADAGDVGAIPLLRLSFAGDIAGDVRDAAGRALGRLGDADSVETFCFALERRADDHDAAKTAAYALGYLGDVRGVDSLIAAYQAAWLPEVVAEALAAVGSAAIPFVIEAIEKNPDLLKRTTARRVLDAWRPSELLPALLERADAIAEAADFVKRASALLDIVKDQPQLTKDVGGKILQLRPDLATKGGREERALAKKAGAVVT
jgi:hypothetical protein